MPKKLSAMSKSIISNSGSQPDGVKLVAESLETLIKKKQKKAPNGFAYIPIKDIQVVIDELRKFNP